FYGLVAAVIAMLAVQSLEDGLMIRRGMTHLPARDRAARLISLSLNDDRIYAHERTLGKHDRSFRKRIESERFFLETLITGLMEATERAADFGESPSGFDWTALPAAQIIAPSVVELREVARLDLMLSGGDQSLVAALSNSPLYDGALHAIAV